MKKILPLLLALCLLAGCGPSRQAHTPEEPEKLQIVATVFPAMILPAPPPESWRR